MIRRLEHVSRALSEVFAAHLHMEESVIFPVLDELLDAEQMRQIKAEMHLRRRPQQEGIHLVQ